MVVKTLNWATLGAVLWCALTFYQLSAETYSGRSLGHFLDRAHIAYFAEGSFLAGVIFAVAHLLYRFLLMLNRKFPD